MSCEDYEDLFVKAIVRLETGKGPIEDVKTLRKLYNGEIQVLNSKGHKQKLIGYDRRIANVEYGIQRKQLLHKDLENPDDMLRDTVRIQEKTTISIKNTITKATEARDIGIEVLDTLKTQQEQITKITTEVQNVTSEINKSKRIISNIARRMASDRLLMCVVFIFVAVIIAVIAVVSVNKKK